jgi:uncharacterized membrane protein YdbT with pleckstrin-like domain
VRRRSDVPVVPHGPSYAHDVAFPRNLLHDNEELVLDLRPHWYSLAKPALVVVGAIVATVLMVGVWSPDGDVGSFVNILSAVLVVGSLGFFGWKYLVWNSTMFVLTSDRIVSRRGLLTKSGIEIPLERVNTVFFSQTVFERMLGSGDVAIESAGERGNETFDNIRKPSIVQKEIYVQMEHNEQRKADRMHAAFQAGASATPAAASIPEQIEKLSELHQRGVLSDAEYQHKKAELLDRM